MTFDFIVLCRHLPAGQDIAQLQHLHNRIQQQFRRPKLSGFYLTKPCLQLQVGQTVGVQEGKVKEARWGKGLSAITLKELQSIAFTITGTKAHSLPISIRREVVDLVLFENINSYWKRWINRHADLPHRYFLLLSFPWFTEWAVLGVARQLYTLQTGEITSKLNAGQFALRSLPGKYRQIIQQAMNIREQCSQFDYAPSVQRANRAIGCVKFMIRQFNDVYCQHYGSTIPG